MAVARRHPEIELLAVDSMQVYRGMDIGTAKPRAEDRAVVAHHLIDLIGPEEEFTVVDYQSAAVGAEQHVRAKGGRPVYVGGTGLYVRAVVDRLTAPPRYPEIVADLERQDTARLYERLRSLDPAGAQRMEPTNRRRVLRALEVTLGSGRPFSSFGPGLLVYPETRYRLVGIDCDRALLDERISARYRRQLDEGFLDEVRRLAAAPGGIGRTASQALGYRELLAHLAGRLGLDQAVELAVQRTRRFARRQQRWFRRDPRITWLTHSGDLGPVVDHVDDMLGRT
jgi:tRNA dimethylallyltransferase